MSRKKVILSIFLMIALVLVGIVLPTIWKMEKHDSEKETESTQTPIPEKESAELKETVVQPEYIHFDALQGFFSENQIKDLKEQFPAYFEEIRQSNVSSVEFLPDETSYPEKDTTLLQFSLSDGEILPVTYSTSSGAFFFGEEKLQVSTPQRTYPRQTDDTLPPVTTEEIEARQEGGFADTTDDVIEETEPVNTPDDSSKQNSDTGEVQP